MNLNLVRLPIESVMSHAAQGLRALCAFVTAPDTFLSCSHLPGSNLKPATPRPPPRAYTGFISFRVYSAHAVVVCLSRGRGNHSILLMTESY